MAAGSHIVVCLIAMFCLTFSLCFNGTYLFLIDRYGLTVNTFIRQNDRETDRKRTQENTQKP